MSFDVSNPVVALCVAGVQVEGTPVEALALYDQAWAARTDDFDAVDALPADGYADMVRGGINRLRERLATRTNDAIA